MDTLQMKIYKLIHRGKIDIDEISELFGVGINSIYKMGDEDSSLVKALRRIGALMKIQKDYGILDYYAQRGGYLLVKIPRVGMDKRADAEIISAFQKLSSEAVQQMIRYFEDPENSERRDALTAIMLRCAERSIAIKKRAENGNQINMFRDQNEN